MNILPIFFTILVTSTSVNGKIQVDYPDETKQDKADQITFELFQEAIDTLNGITEKRDQIKQVLFNFNNMDFEVDLDEDEGETTTETDNETTTTIQPETTTTEPDEDFSGISFLYGALAGVGGIVLVVAVVFVIKAVSKPSSDLNSFELNDYVTDESV